MGDPAFVELGGVRKQRVDEYNRQRLFTWFSYNLRPAVQTAEDAIQEVFEIVGELDDDDKDMRLGVLKERMELMLGLIEEKATDARITN